MPKEAVSKDVALKEVRKEAESKEDLDWIEGHYTAEKGQVEHDMYYLSLFRRAEGSGLFRLFLFGGGF